MTDVVLEKIRELETKITDKRNQDDYVGIEQLYKELYRLYDEIEKSLFS